MPAGSRRPAAWRPKKAGDAPHIILFPEIKFDAQAFLSQVKAVRGGYGYCVVVVSEGVRNPDGGSWRKPAPAMLSAMPNWAAWRLLVANW